MITAYTGGRVFTAASPATATAFVVSDNVITYVGDAEGAREHAADATVHDLRGATVLPGFVDAHAHVVMTGEALLQVDLWGAASLHEMQSLIAAAAAANPTSVRIRAHGWRHDVVGAAPTRAMLDAVVPDRPVYAQSFDFHSMWVNSAALAETGIDAQTISPPGGAIHTDAAGEPTGLIDETAMHTFVTPFLDAAVSASERDDAVRAVLDGYRKSGITAVTDMGLDADQLEALSRAEAAGELSVRIAGHWFITPTHDAGSGLAQVAEAARLATVHTSDRLRVVGIKVMIDGTIDGCTAAVSAPYADGTTAEPIWSLAELVPVVTAADAAGLQVAMHAIGDEAVRIAIAAVEEAARVNGPRERRHRIEHLEVATTEEIERLAALGITASMQPVHSDPAIQQNWRAMLGDERVDRGYPWPEITAAGGTLAFGTDSPTSAFDPLRNLFVAATRRSAIDPALPANIGHFALPLADAVRHATRDAAWASGGEHLSGAIEIGRRADFVVLDRDIFSTPVDELLAARVVCTVVDGTIIHLLDGVAR